jgi:DnaJ family protein A protein 2
MDLYSELGVGRNATADEIKRAYRREAVKRHPDRPGGDKEAFQRLQVANEILSDVARRADYDMTGQIPGAAEGPSSGGGMPDLSAIFGSLFGGGIPMPPPGFFGGGGPVQLKVRRGPNKVHDIGVSLADLYTGKTFTLNIKREVLCSGCHGTGGEKIEKCGVCRGAGMRMRAQQMGPITAMMQEPCAACDQTGQRVIKECGDCGGKRVVERESVLDVKIERGMQAGDTLVFPGQCSESPLFEEPGDVILIIRAATTDSGRWLRRGADLMVEVQISVAESLLGWAREFVDHPSGLPLRLAWREGVIRDGEVLRVPGWGMPVKGKEGERGELRLLCRVATVDQGAWSEEQLRALKCVWPDWVEPDLEGAERPTRA